MPADLENSAVATGLEKVRLHSNPNKGNAEECSNYCTIALISHASKVMLKILQARLQQYMNWKFSDVQTGVRKGRGKPEIWYQHLLGYRKSKGIPEKHLLCFTDYTKAFDCMDHNKLWKIIKEMGITTDHVSCFLRKQYMGQEATVRTLHWTTDWFKIGKRIRQVCVLPPSYLTYRQSTSCEMLGWMNHKLESRLLGKISATSDRQIMPLKW